MNRKLYRFHSDPGHGWLEVNLQELWDLDIHEKVSHFSYEKLGTVYLEEDCDATLFFEAYKKLNGHFPEIEEVMHDNKAPFRNFPRFDSKELDLLHGR